VGERKKERDTVKANAKLIRVLLDWQLLQSA